MKGSEDHVEPWIETFSGRTFHLQAPEFDIGDIAHALSLTTRWAGHCKKFYSVAEHSVVVMSIMADVVGGDPLEGLLHDATEAYFSDMPSPFKQLLPDWRLLDAGLETAMRSAFDLTPIRTDECIEADWIALYMEGNVLMHSKGEKWPDPYNLREKALKLQVSGVVRTPVGHHSTLARDNFHNEFKRLMKIRAITNESNKDTRQPTHNQI